eukprot:COSAG05_NODE_14083_length_408_cov_1.504854_1_plen_51_part_01
MVRSVVCPLIFLSTLGSGHGNNVYIANCAAWGCLPTPDGHDSNGNYWGSTS